MPGRKVLIIAFCMFAACAGEAIARQTTQLFDIPAMDLREALTQFSRETGVSISFGRADIDGYKSAYLFGDVEPASALEIILSRSPYDFEFIGEDTVRIVPRKITQIPGPLSNQPGRVSMKPDTILVTATKREEYAQKVPASISAVDGAYLHERGIRDFNTLAPKLAGVAFTDLGPSRNKIFLRGISDGSFADRTQSTVGIYLDETPIIFNDTNPDIRLVDIDRLEVIRGPQGTLYGSGSLGGVYRIITNKPDLETFSGYARASGAIMSHGGAKGEFDGALNVPVITERLGVRLAGYYDRSGGYIDEILLNSDDVNSSEIYGGRASARLQIAEDWTADVVSTLQVVDLDDTQYRFPDLGDLRRANLRREPYKDDFRQWSFTIDGDVNDISVTSSSAYIRRDTDSVFDASSALPSLVGDMGAEGIYRTDNKIHTFNNETRLVSDYDGRFNWLLGGFFLDRTEWIDSDLIVDNSTPQLVAFFSNRKDTLKEIAGFGEISFEFIDRVTLTAGARWSRSKYGTEVISGGPILDEATDLDESRIHKSLSPKIAFSWHYSDDLLIYIQGARGERIGGFNVTTPLEAITLLNPEDDVSLFEPDKLWNTELGVKSSWLDGDLIVNAAAFYVHWSEIQTDQILPSGFSFIANAGKARNIGFEMEITARPTANVELAGALFWNNPELTEANPFLGAEVGDALPNIARLSASFSAIFDFPISPQWDGRFSADYSYIGRSYLTFAEVNAPRMGDYHVGNVRVSARKYNLQAGFFVDNIWDETGNTFAFGNPFSFAQEDQGTPVKPRTFGVFIEANF